MRIVIGYRDGHKLWRDEGPSELWLEGRPGRGIGGSAVEAVSRDKPPRDRSKPAKPC